MTTVYSVLKLKGQRESWWNSVRYLQTDKMGYPQPGSQESEWQEKENLGYILNQTVGVVMVSLTSKGHLWKQPFSKNHYYYATCFFYLFVCCLVTQLCPILMTPWTVAHQVPLSMGFPRQESLSGLPFSSSRGFSQPRDWTHVSWILIWTLFC